MSRRTAVLSAAGRRVAAAAVVVDLSPGDDVQAAINANPAGTIFNFAAGTYNISGLAPKSGDVFDGGNRAAVLDGQNTAEHAFISSTTDGVTIRGFVIKRYDSELQAAAIQSFGTTNWTIENNHITLNAATAVATDTGARVLNNLMDFNGQAGYAAHGHDLRYEGNEIAFNNFDLAVDATWEAGGGKAWDTQRAVFRNNYCHDNGGNGLWDDTNNIHILYDGNICDNNWGAGIYHEVGYEATIINNVVRWNGMPTSPDGGQDLGWLWNAGIQIRTCRPVDSGSPILVANNIVIDNYNGIALLDSPPGGATNPGESAYGTLYLGDVVVQGNYIAMTRGASGVVQDGRGAGVFAQNLTWANNDYRVASTHEGGDVYNWHAWLNLFHDLPTWQGYGNDLTGSTTSGIAVDSSSPARVTTPGDGSVATTAAFNQPPNCVLLFCGAGAGGGQTFTVSNNGDPLGWTEIALRNSNDPGGSSGTVHLFYAVSPRPRAGLTVTATYSTVQDTSFKVYVLTGVDTYDPIGGVAEGSSTSTPLTTTAYASQVAGSLSFVTTCDYNATGAPTSSDSTLDSGDISAQISFGSGYKTVATAGASVTHNIQVGGGPALNWVTVEIRKS